MPADAFVTLTVGEDEQTFVIKSTHYPDEFFIKATQSALPVGAIENKRFVDAPATNSRRECDEWAELAGGTRDYVDENPNYVTSNPERYARLFGIDLRTLEPVT